MPVVANGFVVPILEKRSPKIEDVSVAMVMVVVVPFNAVEVNLCTFFAKQQETDEIALANV